MRFKTKIAVVVFSTLIAFYAIVGSFMSKSSQVVARGSQYGQISIFDEVLSHIIRDYVEQPDLEKVRIGSLRGLAEGLDPYSAYLTPEQVKQYDPKASRAETGMILSKVGGYAYVVAVLKGSPADQLGIKGGDFIEYVGKVPSRDLSLYDVEQLVNGQAGTTIDLRVLHQGQSRKLTVTRAKITQPATESRIEEPGVGYIKVASLTDGKAAEVKAAVTDLMTKGAQKIVLDLRGAANGKLQEGVSLANLFIGSGTLARTLGKADKEIQTFSADPAKVVFNGPLVVVIDRSTSGPAEILAAAVRDQKRGELVGEKTFGTGSDQQLFSLSDGGALLLTTAKYAPASGKAFMEEPINPTVKVDRIVEAETILPDTDDDDDADKPEQQPQPQAAPAAPPKPVEDVQLKKAFELVKQAPAKGAAAQKHAAAAKAPAAIGSYYDDRMAT
ncbi:MAG TPA: S41 family peptidase [Blastocatellia bacterium]|nr:S41 family peptidase [Blastocatellia bacterium]